MKDLIPKHRYIGREEAEELWKEFREHPENFDKSGHVTEDIDYEEVKPLELPEGEK
jgi:hypothetical protein